MIETKQIRLVEGPKSPFYSEERYQEYQKYIHDMIAFRWEPTQQTEQRQGKATYQYLIMARETTIEHYEEYCKLEKDYETAKSSIQAYKPMEFMDVVLLLILFVIPGVVYITCKVHQKKDINRTNDEAKAQMQRAVYLATNNKE